jgi:hypothetical protein
MSHDLILGTMVLIGKGLRTLLLPNALSVRCPAKKRKRVIYHGGIVYLSSTATNYRANQYEKTTTIIVALLKDIAILSRNFSEISKISTRFIVGAQRCFMSEQFGAWLSPLLFRKRGRPRFDFFRKFCHRNFTV